MTVMSPILSSWIINSQNLDDLDTENNAKSRQSRIG